MTSNPSQIWLEQVCLHATEIAKPRDYRVNQSAPDETPPTTARADLSSARSFLRASTGVKIYEFKAWPIINLSSLISWTLRAAVHERVLNEMLGSVNQGGWKVLVLDDLTTR
eukprot:1146446-Pelagomonas_calceolata.AAC.1